MKAWKCLDCGEVYRTLRQCVYDRAAVMQEIDIPGDQFLRGSRVLAPVNHIVAVTLANGAQHYRRVAMNAEQMRFAELKLMELQHAGEIRGYIISSACDCSFGDLVGFLGELGTHAQQQELLNVQQDTLFAGGGQ